MLFLICAITHIQAAAGNIFQRRKDLSVFATLPKCQRNPYHIKLEVRSIVDP